MHNVKQDHFLLCFITTMKEVVTAVVEDHSLVNWVTQSFRALIRHALNVVKNHLASYRHSEAHRHENAPVAKRAR